MHYYKRNLGDYAKKAGRLSMLQHGSYTLLIDSCYDRETFPTIEQAIEWTWASTTEEVEAVKFVLGKFFVLIDGVYVQTRIQEELSEYQSKADKNKRIAIDRETKRKENITKRARNVNAASESGGGSSPNQEPLTINQEPLTINQEPLTKDKTAANAAPPDGVSQSLWDDFKKVRAAKKAAITKTAMAGIAREADKAGITLSDALTLCCERGWISFKADWYANSLVTQSAVTTSRTNQPMSFAERDRIAGIKRWEEMTGRVHPDNIASQKHQGDVIDITPTTLKILQ